MASVADNSASSLNLQFEDIADKLFEHMLLKSQMLQALKLETRPIDGKYWRVDYQTSGNTYMGARARGDFHPGYDSAANAEDGFAGYATSELKYHKKDVYMSYDFTGQMRAAIKSRKGGYVNLQKFRLDDTIKHMNFRVGLKLAGTRLGTIGRVQTADVVGGGDNTQIRVRYAGYAAASVRGYENGAYRIQPGLRLDCTTATRSGALRAGATDRGRKVNAVELDEGSDSTGPKVTLNSAHTGWAAGDYLVTYKERAATAISSSSDYEDNLYNPLGLLDLVDDGDIMPYIGGVDRTAAGNDTLKALIIEDAANPGVLRDLTPAMINLAYDRLMNISGGMPDVFISTFGVQRRFVNHLFIQGASSSANNNPMRYSPQSKQQIGFNSYDVYPLGAKGKLTFMPVRESPHHTGFLLDRSSAVLLQDAPPDFIDYDGNKIRKVVGKDEATSDLVWRLAGVCGVKPYANVRLEDLAGSHMED